MDEVLTSASLVLLQPVLNVQHPQYLGSRQNLFLALQRLHVSPTFWYNGQRVIVPLFLCFFNKLSSSGHLLSSPSAILSISFSKQISSSWASNFFLCAVCISLYIYLNLSFQTVLFMYNSSLAYKQSLSCSFLICSHSHSYLAATALISNNSSCVLSSFVFQLYEGKFIIWALRHQIVDLCFSFV